MHTTPSPRDNAGTHGPKPATTPAAEAPPDPASIASALIGRAVASELRDALAALRGAQTQSDRASTELREAGERLTVLQTLAESLLDDTDAER